MILIVDDRHENVFSLKRLLEINKFEVDTAYSGEEALKKILQNSYSLVILDVQMPGMDGFEVAEVISGYSKTKDLPIIFLSAVNVEKQFISKGYASGGIDYVTKPLDPDILLLKVKTFYRLSEQAKNLNISHGALKKENEFRKKAENELNNRIGELKSFIEAIPHIAFTIQEDGAIEFVNHLWYSYSGDPTIFPETHDQEPSIETCWKIASMQKERYVTELRIKKLSTNEFRYHLLMVTPVEIDHTIIKWACTLTDIHEQKSITSLLEERVKERTRELQEMNSQLENSNENLQQFASVASHDLKEPLRKIETFGSIIKEKYLVDDTLGIGYIDRIMSSSKRMTHLINNLLDYSSVVAVEAFEFSELGKIIEEVVQDLEHIIQDRNAVIEVDCPHELDMIPGQMRQVFQNMLSNALKFAKKDMPSVIRIHSETVIEKMIDSPVGSSGIFCRITIQDNGIGFSEQYQERIFEVFQRLNSKSQYEGNGIGLAIVKKIVNNHQGIISAKGAVNEGACFTIVLPIRQPSNS